AVGDTIKPEDTLIVLESDKASMEVPSPAAGKVVEIQLKIGDKVKQGSPILIIEAADSAAPEKKSAASPKATAEAENKTAKTQSAATKAVTPPPTTLTTTLTTPPTPTAKTSVIEIINVPDLGGSDSVDVIEVFAKTGTQLAEGDAMIALESDKTSMEIPAPKAGTVRALKIKVGDKVSAGSPILELEVSGAPPAAAASATATAAVGTASTPAAETKSTPPPAPQIVSTQATIIPTDGDVYAGPAVRKYARELGIDLTKVKGTGPKNRIQREDLKAFIKSLIENRGATTSGSGIPPIPDVDFAKFGEIEVQALTKLNKLTATNMHRSWLNLPHVTQFDDADITELEDFRASLKEEADKRGVKVTPLPFLLKACAIALKVHPKFNASLLNDGEHIVFKKYIHIGIAVDTPAGLVVPVVRNVDRKSVWDLAAETAELSQKAKDRKLKPDEMQGGCFTISSLGNIGGTGFTPIINAPEVAILAVSKLAVKPQWNGKEFVPRKMLPLSLSYDHRVVNGADAGRFFTFLTELLADIRRLVL
ncbi:MAG TPA: dihydrolipoyllysine-residue acetyltransferase, partial [Spongiibacteraceae bacterium]|nr:dihydrolipoyllysine-residue acetyltransferase [Spongiibacteraceae bacterium]